MEVVLVLEGALLPGAAAVLEVALGLELAVELAVALLAVALLAVALLALALEALALESLALEALALLAGFALVAGGGRTLGAVAGRRGRGSGGGAR